MRLREIDEVELPWSSARLAASSPEHLVHHQWGWQSAKGRARRHHSGQKMACVTAHQRHKALLKLLEWSTSHQAPHWQHFLNHQSRHWSQMKTDHLATLSELSKQALTSFEDRPLGNKRVCIKLVQGMKEWRRDKLFLMCFLCTFYYDRQCSWLVFSCKKVVLWSLTANNFLLLFFLPYSIIISLSLCAYVYAYICMCAFLKVCWKNQCWIQIFMV